MTIYCSVVETNYLLNKKYTTFVNFFSTFLFLSVFLVSFKYKFIYFLTIYLLFVFFCISAFEINFCHKKHVTILLR